MFFDGIELMEIFGVNLHIEAFLTENRELPLESKIPLLDAMNACEYVKKRDTRDVIVRELDNEIHSTIGRSNVDNIDILNILNTCCRYPNGLESLLIVISYFEKKSRQMQHLKRTLFALFVELHHIKPETYKELVKIMDKVKYSVGKNDLMNMHSQSILLPVDKSSDISFVIVDDDEIYDVIVAKLLQFPQQHDGTLPLFTFIDHLIEHVSGQVVQNELMEWRAKAAKEAGIEVRKGDVSSDTSSYHLVIKFKPDCNKLEEEEFYVRAWLLRKTEGKKLESLFDMEKAEVYCPYDKTDFFDELIKKCEIYTDHFTVELFLPFSLLNHKDCDMHQWSYDVELENRMLLIHKYPLVFRSYERAYEGKIRMMRAWNKNWKNFRAYPNGTVPTVVKKRYYIEKEAYIILYLEGLPYVAMTFVPPPFDKQVPRHIFKHMLSAGTSVALWPRILKEDLDEDSVEQQYSILLSGKNFSELPRILLEGRRREPDNKRSLANILTLFYDDPDILPPELLIPDRQPRLFAAPKEG